MRNQNKVCIFLLLVIIGITSCKKDCVKQLQHFISEKKYEKTIDKATKCLSKSDDRLIYAYRGVAYYNIGEYNKAYKDLVYAIINEEVTPEIIEVLILTEEQLGKYEEAIMNTSKLINFDSTNIDYFYRRGELYGKLGAYENTIDDMSFVIRKDSTYTNALNERGLAYCKLGSYKNAIKDFSSAIEIKPTESSLYYNRAISLMYMKNNAMALKDLNKSIKIDSTNGTSYYNRAIVHMFLDMKNESCNDLEKAISLNFNNIEKELYDYCNLNILEK
ncbi:MAG: tetratricopeptide repeat protein [Chitinophagales bacterium]|nr:tetratricopeptide repeat protein [Chitinophagales bacterium]